MSQQNNILWQPAPADLEHSWLREYRLWLKENKSIETGDYESLWEWSVDDPGIFWKSIADFFQVKFHSPPNEILDGEMMPDVRWFDGATLNYAEHIDRGMTGQSNAIVFASEQDEIRTIAVADMWKEVARIQHYYRDHGIEAGDRIVGFLPNIPEATFAFLAAISLGAVWSCCSPDFGVSSVTDRFIQIKPSLFIAADGYMYGGKKHNRLNEVRDIRSKLPGLKNTLLINYMGFADSMQEDGITLYDHLEEPQHLIPDFIPVSFDHPLWILYSSGTTGVPKAITHSHGGCLLEHYKYLALQNDVHAGENFFWYTTTGWMMWNFLHASMLTGATIVLYDGSPGYPDLNHLWKIAESLEIHHFGTSAPYLIACMKEKNKPGELFDLSKIRSIGSTGSPLPPEAFDWVYDSVHPHVWLCSMSGGSDVCTAFVGGVIEKPVVRGEIQGRALGCSLYALDSNRKNVIDALGEMVLTKPMPSMPIYFWNDEGRRKYKASYFEDIPGVWKHGDFVKITYEGGIIIYGRSDATLNRQGIRIGTAEIYRAINEVKQIADSLIVNLELEGGRHYMPLFVKMQPGEKLDENLIKEIKASLRSKCSPRHVPDDIISTPDIPYTISGKKMEAPVKKILMGMDIEQSLNKDAMKNPESLEFFLEFVIPGE